MKVMAALIFVVVLMFYNGGTTVSPAPPFSTIIIGADYRANYTKTVNESVEYVFRYATNNITSMETVRITVESNATHSLPLLIVVRQPKGILSWQIPLLVSSKYFGVSSYNKTSRTLCARKYYRSNVDDEEQFILVSISTASYHNVLFNLFVKEEDPFEISLNESRTVTISPAEPIYYSYIFPGQIASSSVILTVESDNNICTSLSIQNTTCPVFDLEENIEFSGYWQTMSFKGGITISREEFPVGFFIVLVVKADDTDCVGKPSKEDIRSKNVTLTIHGSITKEDYIFASTLVVSLATGFCAIYVISVIVFKIKDSRQLRQEILNNQDCPNFDNNMYSSSTVEEVGCSREPSAQEDSSLDEDDIDIMEDTFSDKEIIRTKIILSVCDLAHKDPKILRHKSRLYLYYLATVAVFYTLPVVQLVITYQNVLHVTGNQDMCYYNFLCAHPLGFLSDFNHVFSNFAYILLGLLFIFLTYSREHNQVNREKNKSFGIPQHYGLFYAMGMALIMEGILSASYHVCPNHSNFQFDSSFMYIISVLCMVKIYQTRHPDINARAPVTFGVLALIIFIGLVGVLNGSIYFWALSAIIHLVFCLILTVQIYYMGRWKCNRGVIRRVIQNLKHDARCGIRHLCRPIYPGRFVMLVAVNLCNVGLAVVGNEYHENFATFLLAVLMSNLLLYTFFYIIMKFCHREIMQPQAAIYILLSISCWGAALYFFINKTISWAVTPAQSRAHNKPCILFNFFDYHDIWHFLSAFAMFFSFMVLLTLDDDLDDVHRSQIPVF